MKILIAYDGSPCADEAIEDLQRAALPDDVEALVLSVADLLLPPYAGAIPSASVHITTLIGEARANSAAMMEAAKVRAHRAAEELRATFPTWQIKAKHIADSPAWGIVLEAEAWKADLIVLGTHGHSALGRLVLGSVSQTVLTHAPCSVRIGRAGRTTPASALRILVGIDGSPESELAVQMAAQRAWPAGTAIRLMMVVEPSLLAAMSPSAAQTKQSTLPTDEIHSEIHSEATQLDDLVTADLVTENAIQAFLDRQLARFGQKPAPQNEPQNEPEHIPENVPVNVCTMILSGNPKQLLVDEAESWGADCIFIGSRGLNRWERLLLGSVSAAVAARAHCPVEVIRTPRAVA